MGYVTTSIVPSTKGARYDSGCFGVGAGQPALACVMLANTHGGYVESKIGLGTTWPSAPQCLTQDSRPTIRSSIMYILTQIP